MASATVRLTFFGLGTPRTGLWCSRCLLPSGYEVDLYFLVNGAGPRVLQTAEACADCGGAAA